MQNILWTKGIILGIILLVGTNVLPSINGNIVRNEYDSHSNTIDIQNNCYLPPWVTTWFATNVDPWGQHATLNGDLLSRGGYDYCYVWFVWDTQFHWFYSDYAHSTSKIKKSTLGFFDTTITGLERGVTYSFRAVADNGESSDQGVALKFRPGEPSISTIDASSISSTTARLNGHVEDTGGVTCQVWFVLDTSPHDSYSEYQITTQSSPKTSTGDVSVEVTNLRQNTKYFFRAVISNDVDTTSGFEHNFTTKAGNNHPPNLPSDPYPENGSIDVPTDIQLNWVCSDPDNDPITYDIYFGLVFPLEKIQNNLTNNTFSLNKLDYNELYFWQIVAWDINGDSTYGPIWRFYTEVDIAPPDPPVIIGPTKGPIDTNSVYIFLTTDPEGHGVYYFIDWGDGTNSSWIGSYPSGNQITGSHTWSKRGTYIIKAKAKDTADHESDWGTLSVTMPCAYDTLSYQFWERLSQRFPNAFPLLRHLMGY